MSSTAVRRSAPIRSSAAVRKQDDHTSPRRMLTQQNSTMVDEIAAFVEGKEVDHVALLQSVLADSEKDALQSQLVEALLRQTELEIECEEVRLQMETQKDIQPDNEQNAATLPSQSPSPLDPSSLKRLQHAPPTAMAPPPPSDTQQHCSFSSDDDAKVLKKPNERSLSPRQRSNFLGSNRCVNKGENIPSSEFATSPPREGWQVKPSKDGQSSPPTGEISKRRDSLQSSKSKSAENLNKHIVRQERNAGHMSLQVDQGPALQRKLFEDNNIEEVDTEQSLSSIRDLKSASDRRMVTSVFVGSARSPETTHTGPFTPPNSLKIGIRKQNTSTNMGDRKRLSSSTESVRSMSHGEIESRPRGMLPLDVVQPNACTKQEEELLYKERYELLLRKLKFLQSKFENPLALANALYGETAASRVISPARVGYLTKQGGSIQNWKRRFFVLKDNFLFYYKKPTDDQPTGVVYLDDYKVEDAASKGLEHCFSITTPSRVWYMQADRQIDMDIWMECLRNALPWYVDDATDKRIMEEVMGRHANVDIMDKYIGYRV